MISDTFVECVASPTHQDLLMFFKSLNCKTFVITCFLDVFFNLRHKFRCLFQHLAKRLFRILQTTQKVVEIDQRQQEVVEWSHGYLQPFDVIMSNWFKLDSRCWLKWSALATALHFLSWLPSLNSIDEVETAWKVYQWSELESSLTMVSNFMIHLSGSSCGKHFPIRASLCGSLWICFKSLSAVGHWKHCAHFVLIIHQVSICGWTLENFSYFKL